MSCRCDAVYLSCERSSDFSLAIGVGSVAGSTDLQRRQHVTQVLPLDVGRPLNPQGVAVARGVGHVPGAGLARNKEVEEGENG